MTTNNQPNNVQISPKQEGAEKTPNQQSSAANAKSSPGYNADNKIQPLDKSPDAAKSTDSK